MVYDPNIPQPNDRLSVSQNDILVNFQQLNISQIRNHFDLTSSDTGYHKLLNMPEEQGATPTSNTDEMIVYTQNFAPASQPELMILRENTSDGNKAFPITRFGITAGGLFPTTNSGTATTINQAYPFHNVNTAALNITNVAQTYTVNFLTPLTSTNYYPLAWVWDTANNNISLCVPVNLTVNNFGIQVSGSITNRLVFFMIIGGWY